MKNKTFTISKVLDTDFETLFKIVSDFSLYKNWNTVIPDANGSLVTGTELQLTMRVGGKVVPFNPKVMSIVPNKNFLLSKTLFSKTLLELTHKFEFKQLSDHQTEFIQTWEGKGVLVAVLWKKIANGFSDFEIFNNDLEKYLIDRKSKV